MFARKHFVRINYKSGLTESFWAWKFDYRQQGGSVTDLAWDAAPGGPEPKVIGIDSIESVWLIKSRFAFKGFKA